MHNQINRRAHEWKDSTDEAIVKKRKKLESTTHVINTIYDGSKMRIRQRMMDTERDLKRVIPNEAEHHINVIRNSTILDTVTAFQGRQASVSIVVTTKTDTRADQTEEQKQRDFVLRDERVATAISRPQEALFIIGHVGFLDSRDDGVWSRLFDNVDKLHIPVVDGVKYIAHVNRIQNGQAVQCYQEYEVGEEDNRHNIEVLVDPENDQSFLLDSNVNENYERSGIKLIEPTQDVQYATGRGRSGCNLSGCGHTGRGR